MDRAERPQAGRPPTLAEDPDAVRRSQIRHAGLIAQELVRNLALNPVIWDPVEALDVAIAALSEQRDRLAALRAEVVCGV